MQSKLNRNFIIGISFLIALVLLYFGVNFLKGSNILKKKNTYVVLFDDVSGLYTSSPIYVSGFQIGLVSSLKIHSTNPIKFAVNINLEDNYRVPKGSYFEFGSDLLGASAVSLIVNDSSGELCAPGDTLFGQREVGMMTNVGKIIPRADSLLLHLDSIALSLNKLMNSPVWEQSIKGIGYTIAELNKTSQNLNVIMSELKKDLPQISQNLAVISNDLKNVSSELNSLDIAKAFNSIDSTLVNINHLSNRLISEDNTLGKLTANSQLHDSLTNTLTSVSKLLDEIRLDPKKFLTVKVKLF